MTGAATTEKVLGATRSVLLRRDYLLLLTSFATSRVGDFLYLVALSAYVYERTGSAAWVSAAALSRFIPYTVLSAPAGVVADRQTAGATDRVDLGGGNLPQFGIDSSGTVVAVSTWRGADGEAPHVRLLEWSTGRQLADIPASSTGQVAVRPGARELLLPVDPQGIQRYTFEVVPVGPTVQASAPPDGGFDYSPDGSRLVYLSDRTAQVLDADTLQPVSARFTVTGTAFVTEEWRPDGRRFLISSDDGSISVVDAATGELLDRFTGAARITAATFVDADHVVSVANGGSSTFDLTQLTSLGTATTEAQPFGRLVPLPDGGALAGQGADLVVVDEHGVHPDPVAQLPVEVGSLAVTRDGRRIAVLGAPAGGGPAEVVLVDRATGEILWNVPAQGSDTSSEGRVAFSPDGKRLALGTYDGAVAVLDAATGKTLVRQAEDKIRVGSLLWSRDGSVLFEGGHDGVLRRLDPATLKAAPHAPLLTSERTLTEIAASPDGRTLAVSAEDGTIHFVDASTGQPVGEPLDSEGSELQTVAFSPDDRWVTAISRDGALRVWERDTGRAVGPPLEAHGADSAGLAWLADGTLVTASTNGTLVAWGALSPDRWARRACDLVGHDLSRDLWARYLPDQPYRRTCAGL